jgi:hypothetical protein
MAVAISRFRPIAIALVLQDDDGNLQIIGSKSIENSMIEWVPGPRSYHIEADCNSVLWQRGTPASLPRQIEQRGIYLPDMSFRALPGPEET